MQKIVRVDGQTKGSGWSASFPHGQQKRTFKRANFLHKPLKK